MHDQEPRRTLVVDDDEGIREALRDVLQDEGYTVVEAPDALVALEILRAFPSPMVVITNHNMPRLDGPGLLAFVAEEPYLQRNRYLYMTAGNRVIPPTLDRQLAALRIPVLRKPFEIDELLRLVGELADQLDAPPPRESATDSVPAGA